MRTPTLSGATWRKSSHSSHNGSCVEVAFTQDATAVRDSKNPSGPALVFPGVALAEFVAAVKGGRFDRA